MFSDELQSNANNDNDNDNDSNNNKEQKEKEKEKENKNKDNDNRLTPAECAFVQCAWMFAHQFVNKYGTEC